MPLLRIAKDVEKYSGDEQHSAYDC